MCTCVHMYMCTCVHVFEDRTESETMSHPGDVKLGLGRRDVWESQEYFYPGSWSKSPSGPSSSSGKSGA